MCVCVCVCPGCSNKLHLYILVANWRLLVVKVITCTSGKVVGHFFTSFSTYAVPSVYYAVIACEVYICDELLH